MPKRHVTITIILLTIMLAGSAVAAGLKEIKIRMTNRLPTINSLKKQGIIGENNHGYLEFLHDKHLAADMVAAENRDRHTVYAAIAKQQQVAIELVEKRRARQIAARAPKGYWLQDENGNWYQKK